MSTYLAARTALLTLCRAAGVGFDAENSGTDYTVLDAGYPLALLVKGQPTEEADQFDGYGSHGARQERHTFEAQVWLDVGNGEGGLEAIDAELIAVTEALKDYVRGYERLNETPNVRRAQIIRTTPPESNGTKSHRVQIVTVQVDCDLEYEPVEVAG